jgi:hypothetical protein
MDPGCLAAAFRHWRDAGVLMCQHFSGHRVPLAFKACS